MPKCKMSSVFDSEMTLADLDKIPRRAKVIKDTFIPPAGDAVVTRIQYEVCTAFISSKHTAAQILSFL